MSKSGFFSYPDRILVRGFQVKSGKSRRDRENTAEFLPDRGIAEHFREMPCTTISVTGPKGAKKDKKPVTKRAWTYVHIRTFSYNISQNYIGYGVFRKHSSLLRFSKTCQFWRQLQKPTDDCVFRCRQSSLQSSHDCEKRGKTLSYLSLGTIIKKKNRKNGSEEENREKEEKWSRGSGN